MAREHYFVVIAIFAALVGTFFLVHPFLDYLVFALLLTYLLQPLRRALQKKITSRSLSSLILILLILIVIILPTIYLSSQLVHEIRSVLSMVADSPSRQVYLEKIESQVERFTGEPVDLHLYKNQLLNQARSFFIRAAPNFLGSLSELKTTRFLVNLLGGTPQPCLDRDGHGGISSTSRLARKG